MFLDVAGGLLNSDHHSGHDKRRYQRWEIWTIYIPQRNIYADCNRRYQSWAHCWGATSPQTFLLKLAGICGTHLYDKSLAFSSYDFEQFGTGSMITRTLNDVNVVQQGAVWFIQMVLPVPAVCIMGIVMAFSIDTMMGFLLAGATVFILLLAILVTRKASWIFDKAPKIP